MNGDYEAICQQAMGWVRRAGALARERFGTAITSHKADRSPVTDVDHAVQDTLLEAIARACPEDAAITEETQSAPKRHQPVASGRRCWVIDPIDGTRNYARSLPVFTISVALMEAGSPVVGLIFDPMAGRMYSATAGGGARLDNQRLEAANQPVSGNTFISVPTSRYEALPAVVHRWIDHMVVRNLGSTALHLALLAGGGLDAVYCRRSRLWDLAAGALLATEAGAEVRSLEGRLYFPIDLTTYRNQEMPFLAGAPAVVTQLLQEYQNPQPAA